MSLAWVAGAVLGVSIGCLVYCAFAKAETFRLQRYEYWADRFYSAAKPLVANPETPPNIISLIEALNKLITKRTAPIGIAEVFREKLQSGSKKIEGLSDPQISTFFKKFPDLARNAEIVSHAGLLAASYTHWVAGVQARAVLADIFSEMELRSHEIGSVDDVEKVEKIRHRTGSLVPIILRR